MILSLIYLSIIFPIFATQSVLHNLTTYVFLTVFTEYTPELPWIPPLLPRDTLQRNLHTAKHLPAYQIIPACPTKPNTLMLTIRTSPSARTRACFSSSYLLQQLLNPHINSKQIGQSSLKDAGFQQVPRETLWHQETKRIRPFTKGGVIITQPVMWFGAIASPSAHTNF